MILLLFLASVGVIELILRHDHKQRSSKISEPLKLQKIEDPRIEALHTQDLMSLASAVEAEKQKQPEYNREHVRSK